jgi:hypothetical protein
MSAKTDIVSNERDDAATSVAGVCVQGRWVEGHVDRSDGFPRVDWDAVCPLIMQEVPEAGLRDAMTSAARDWLVETRDALGAEYRVDESASFLLLSSFSTKHAANLLAFLELARKRILSQLLPGVAKVRGHGKHVAIVFHDVERYYSYIAYYYPPEGHFAASGGLFVTRGHGRTAWGYGHFVLHGRDVAPAERVVAHELTHNCLGHLNIPGWLNEGLATTVESVLMGDNALLVTRQDIEDHQAHWRDGTIQQFWSGAAVHRPDDGSRLTYHLARMAVKALSYDYDCFREFVLLADRKDGGEAAAIKVFGKGLGGLVQQFLGPGEWTPLPETWKAAGNKSDD